MSDSPKKPCCPCESGICLIGLGAVFVIGSVASFLIRPERMPPFEWCFLTALFVYLLFASLIVIWMSVERARGHADKMVEELTNVPSGAPPSKIRKIDRYHDLGLPVWPIVYQWWIVAAVATAVALISMMAIIAHWPIPDESSKGGKGGEQKGSQKCSGCGASQAAISSDCPGIACAKSPGFSSLLFPLQVSNFPM